MEIAGAVIYGCQLRSTKYDLAAGGMPFKECELPLFHIRVKYSPESYQGLLNDPQDREAATTSLAAQYGIKVHNWYFAPDSAEALTFVEGSHEQITLMMMRGYASGAFSDASVTRVISSETLKKYSEKAQGVGQDFSAPNQDEIDRMLLDE